VISSSKWKEVQESSFHCKDESHMIEQQYALNFHYAKALLTESPNYLVLFASSLVQSSLKLLKKLA
jgi:hypothetical protein